ncbi:hypothetical protein TNIN_219251 [Trichonephila inaurata madagascariensis]|uniref:Uncharacterized protein n=1 Tax=Trichonephila inaurata madagascariensis TaxID=2747483 RepID=A0A8X6WXB2_9ARAC|nr:hypothetical protein TNIN_219251 [Trichonephila inaurata madagascariensis]
MNIEMERKGLETRAEKNEDEEPISLSNAPENFTVANIVSQDKIRQRLNNSGVKSRKSFWESLKRKQSLA